MNRRNRAILPLLAFLLSAGMGGCAGAAAAPPAGTPAPDPAAAEALASDLRRATTPSSARQATFGWELDEAGAKLRGRGVVRFRPTDRIRLDLFGPRGETYLAAALVDETPRIPAAVEERFRLPSPALLWGALGVFRPPSAARLQSATTANDSTVTLRYTLEGEGTLEFRSRGGRLLGVRRLERGGNRETLELRRRADGQVERAEYRDWAAYRTLVLTLEATTDVASFPEETWTPPGTAR